MRRLMVCGGCAWLLVMLVGTVVSADKWVRGKVTAVGADSVTVTFKGKEMKFQVTSETDIQGRGLGTAQRRAGGVKLAEAVKAGDGVEVHYVESAGTMRATDIRTGLSGGDAASGADDSGDSASGRVTSLTGNSLTIKSGSGDMTFSIDPKTRVLASGAGAATRDAKAAGGGPAITDLIKVGEEVVVTYRSAGKTPAASEIRVRSPR